MSGRIVNVRPKPGFAMDSQGGIVPSAEVISIHGRDKLTNVMSGMGTSIDRQTSLFYNFVSVTPQQAEAAYRSSWLMRKIVDIPPLDMTRAWRSWQTTKDKIEALEKEERRLGLKAKCKQALILARLWGGGAIILGAQNDRPGEQLAVDRVKKGGLEYIHVVGRHQITAGPLVDDITSEWFGRPQWFDLGTVRLHPSRVVDFIGQRAPEGSQMQADAFWGDPILQSIDGALKNADLSQDGFAALIDEAKIDILKVPGLTERALSSEYETKLLNRLTAAKLGKSVWRTLMIDGDEDWQHKQVTWAGMPDIINTYLQIISGAADIPVTRLLGQSPKGLQSSGDGERKDYHDMVAARQDELLAPALDRIDELLIRSALGTRPSDVWWKFSPLEQMDADELAKIEESFAKAAASYATSALIDDAVLSEIVRNRMIESGAWPGSEAAFENAPEPDEEPDEDEGLTEEERQTRAAEKIGANDATPRPLYVQRKLLNAADLIRWAKAQGFETTVSADEMHVTVLYSRQPVDPMKLGETWSSEKDGGMIVKAGGPRAVERLGEDAVVLLFASSDLVWRHRSMVEAGASHDFPEYQPHVTISFSVPDDFDLDAVKAYTGELRFGPELFEPLVLDWKSKIEEG
jgi:phage-related protein (TIGR01555 family)